MPLSIIESIESLANRDNRCYRHNHCCYRCRRHRHSHIYTQRHGACIKKEKLWRAYELEHISNVLIASPRPNIIINSYQIINVFNEFTFYTCIYGITHGDIKYCMLFKSSDLKTTNISFLLFFLLSSFDSFHLILHNMIFYGAIVHTNIMYVSHSHLQTQQNLIDTLNHDNYYH